MSDPRGPDGGAYDYSGLVREALVGLIRNLLVRAATEGLPGEHHFYLTFGTKDPGVEMSPALRRRFPEEMTIVLQHQFWNLAVDDQGFAVTLRFGGAPERLTVPWAALRAFADPSASFGLRLVQEAGAESADGEAPADSKPVTAAATAPVKTTEASGPDAPPKPTNGASAKVVDLGAYRRREE